jgi:hypothetical protein
MIGWLDDVMIGWLDNGRLVIMVSLLDDRIVC